MCLTGHLPCKAVLEIQELDSGMLSSLGRDISPCWACSWHCKGDVWWVLPAGTMSSRNVTAERPQQGTVTWDAAKGILLGWLKWFHPWAVWPRALFMHWVVPGLIPGHIKGRV